MLAQSDALASTSGRTSEHMAASDTAALKIFISYRRGDAEAYAGRLYDHLRRPFGKANIFMDVDALSPGQDYVEDLETAVAHADVMLAVIGPGWLAAADSGGRRRLDQDLDWVRIEIASALTGGKRVIPILFGGAAMPRQDELPEPLKPLARRHALEFRHERFASDAAGLVKSLRKFQRAKQPTAPPSGTGRANAVLLADELSAEPHPEVGRVIAGEQQRSQTEVPPPATRRTRALPSSKPGVPGDSTRTGGSPKNTETAAGVGRLVDGRYRLIELLGQGEAASIYRARDIQLERDVAVKVFRREYGRDRDFFVRLQQEARAAASLNHPNIVSVFDYGQDEAGPFIVTELVDGEDLASILRRSGAIPPRQAARIVHDAAGALEVAHVRGIVHRDVKPGNILISREGRVKVTDFGIARALAETETTPPGTRLGWLHYLSPEQARGEPTRPASDVYSLGLILYELLAGQPAWIGDSAVATALARLADPAPSPAAVRTGIPPALDAITRRAMEREPEDRYASGGALANALERFLAQP